MTEPLQNLLNDGKKVSTQHNPGRRERGTAKPTLPATRAAAASAPAKQDRRTPPDRTTTCLRRDFSRTESTFQARSVQSRRTRQQPRAGERAEKPSISHQKSAVCLRETRQQGKDDNEPSINLQLELFGTMKEEASPSPCSVTSFSLLARIVPQSKWMPRPASTCASKAHRRLCSRPASTHRRGGEYPGEISRMWVKIKLL
jgi:hypothetical protein